MSATRKPVIVRKFSREWVSGYASANPSLEPEALELLEPGGKLQRIPWDGVKWVCYVREFLAPSASNSDSTSPERLLRRRFAARPRAAGLWLRLNLADGDQIEGIAANDRSLLDTVGFLLTPPDTRSNTQRLFIPRPALRELTVLAVIGANPRANARTGPSPEIQPDLFAAN